MVKRLKINNLVISETLRISQHSTYKPLLRNQHKVLVENVSSKCNFSPLSILRLWTATITKTISWVENEYITFFGEPCCLTSFRLVYRGGAVRSNSKSNSPPDLLRKLTSVGDDRLVRSSGSGSSSEKYSSSIWQPGAKIVLTKVAKAGASEQPPRRRTENDKWLALGPPRQTLLALRRQVPSLLVDGFSWNRSMGCQ